MSWGSPGRCAACSVLSVATSLFAASPLFVASPCFAEAPAAADAEPSAEAANDGSTEIARENYKIGAAAFAEKRFEDAITAFLVADRLAPNAALSFNIARANDELGRADESLYWYGDYLRRSPQAADRDAVLALMAEREQALAARGVQLVVVLTEPPGATVLVGEADMGPTPWHGVLSPGEHALSVRLQGYETWQQTVRLFADRSLVLELELPPQPEEPEVTPAPAVAPAAAPPPRAPAPPAKEGSQFGVWPWVALGAGAVGFGAAAGFEWARQGAEEDAESGQVQVEVVDALDRMDRHQTTARVMLGVGAVFTVLGGTLLVLEHGSSEGVALDLGPRLVPAFDPDSVELQVQQRF